MFGGKKISFGYDQGIPCLTTIYLNIFLKKGFLKNVSYTVV